MKIEFVEILLVCIIVFVQVYIFARTFQQIRMFKNIIPNVDVLVVSRIIVPVTELQKLSPTEILANLNLYKDNEINDHSHLTFDEFGGIENPYLLSTENRQQEPLEKSEVSIIEKSMISVHYNTVFDKILFSVNNYLIRNRGAASDFNLIKDIVERNTDAIEEDINSSIGVPLYLGLMGTMLGIVIGLFNMPDLGAVFDTKQKDLLLNEGIALLIGGVKVAMIASFTGLLLTIINSSWVFKGSRSLSEARKNTFYTFIQIELLPVINQGLASTLDSLQRNLVRFNNEFSNNLRGLTGIFDTSRSAIKEQKELLDALDKAKVSDMTRYNVTVLKQLEVSVGKFEQFNACFANVTDFVQSSQNIVSRTNELLTRTDNFKSIADNLENTLSQSHMLMEFLSGHFSKLEEHREFTGNAVADVGHAISETFRELKEHIQNSSEAVKQFTVDETEALKGALSASKTNLGNLEYLASLHSDVSQFKNSSASQGELLKQAIDNLNVNMAKSIAVLEQIEEHNISSRVKYLLISIRNLFRSTK